MDAQSIIQNTASIIAVLVSVFALYRGIRFVPHETRGMDAEAANKLVQASGIAADQAMKAYARCDELALKLESLEALTEKQETMIETLQAENKNLRIENEELRDDLRRVHDENYRLRREVNELKRLVREYGIEPPKMVEHEDKA